jgi:hypothetical protein
MAVENVVEEAPCAALEHYTFFALEEVRKPQNQRISR